MVGPVLLGNVNAQNIMTFFCDCVFSCADKLTDVLISGSIYQTQPICYTIQGTQSFTQVKCFYFRLSLELIHI